MEAFELKDVKPVPDPIHIYTRQLKSGRIPIIIDNGSYKCRVGWASQSEPVLSFRNLIAKQRKERGKKDGDTQIGNDITNIEAVRFQLRTQFDRDIVTHFEAQEQIMDHIFTHLGIDTEGRVDHPIVMTEAFLNPNYSRNLMNELMFECYGVPGVAYGVDSLLSWQCSGSTMQDGLILRLGHHCTHVMPVLNGQVQASCSRRINVGGLHLSSFLHRLLQLKNPLLAPAISLSRAEELLHHNGRVAHDYQAELTCWASQDYQALNIRRVQLPFAPAPPSSSAPTLTPEQQLQRRRDLAKRLADMNAKKREEKLMEDEEQLNQLLTVQEIYEDGDDEEFQRALEPFSLNNELELSRTITQLQIRIDKTKQRIIASANAPDDGVPVVIEPVEPKMSKLLQEMALAKDSEELDGWIADIKQKRQEILDKRSARRQRKTDMARRRTAAAQERMRIISQLARKDKREDTFGMRDEDWDVYKVINKDGGDTDSEEEQEQLGEIDEVLRRYAPDLGEEAGGAPHVLLARPENYQLLLGTEALRVPELLFQPSMAGLEQGGLAETIEFVLKRFSAEEQIRLAADVFVTGGVAHTPGLLPRLEKELRAMRPFQSTFNVRLADQPSLGAWLGARELGRNSDLLQEALLTRAVYDERGGDCLVEHPSSNPYWASLTPLLVDPVLPVMEPGIVVEDGEVGIF